MLAHRADLDPLLLPFLQTADEERARGRLGELLMAQASPVVRQIIERHLFHAGGMLARTQEADDLHAVVLLRLTAQLQALRGGGEAAPIASLPGYAATAAYNECHAWMRARAPRRARLQSRIRYVLTRDDRLAIREVVNREWWCGTREALDRLAAAPASGSGSGSGFAVAAAAAATDDEVLRCAVEQIVTVRGNVGDPASSPRAFAEFVLAALTALATPCRFTSLVSAFAECLGEKDVRESSPRQSDADELPEVERLQDARPSAVDELAHRQHLTRLWEEIQELLPRQRSALLLNLRDDEGRGMIELWPQTGIASMADLAPALGLTEDQLAELWPTLPRDDQWIAEHLGVTRRQVINLRKCARERLARRLRTLFTPAGTGR
jgi:hypothetical protein